MGHARLSWRFCTGYIRCCCVIQVYAGSWGHAAFLRYCLLNSFRSPAGVCQGNDEKSSLCSFPVHLVTTSSCGSSISSLENVHLSHLLNRHCDFCDLFLSKQQLPKAQTRKDLVLSQWHPVFRTESITLFQ